MKNITNVFYEFLIALCCLMSSSALWAWEDMSMPRLHVEGRYLVDPHGNKVNLHGFAQTYSPWFNEMGQKWDNYDVEKCLKYNQGLIDDIMAAGWKMNFLRLHMDPYWSNSPGIHVEGENDISAFDFNRFKNYLDRVFIPMAEYAVSKGLYVVMRPPGVCPEKIAVGDEYNQYLIKVWTHVAQHPKLKNHPNIMFELANEPINILGPDGTYGAGSQGHFDKLKEYFQSVVDAMRAQGCGNILWIPGLGYQGLYKGFAVNPIEGDNIGYAVHLYPGWMGSDGENGDGGSSTGGYEPFQKGWDDSVAPVASFAPIMITEMDWAPSKYNASWGKAHTGTFGGPGFGANMKHIVDNSGNVSWLIFTGADLLAKFKDTPPAEGEAYTFLTDPEACPWPTYHWYQEYAKENYPRPDFTYQSHSDNGDGTYTNPVIFGDFPDPDVIRVGDVYYMVSTTMYIFPGATILKSYDLVNWEYCCNPLERIEASDGYNLENGQNRYSRGQWATALQYHNGKFYLLFTTLDEGGYLLTTTDIEGEWEKKKLNDGFYDCGLLFDNDKIYVVYGINQLRIAELDEDFNKIPGSDKDVVKWSFREGLEGSRLYKIGEYYYIYSTYGGWPAFQTVFRSKDIYGPYEEKKLIDDDNIHQGALVETQTGEWWTMLFYDKGAYGRFPNLQPVKWVDGWPEIGENGKDITYHFLPAATSKVVVVGNIGDVEYSTIATRVDHIPNDNGSGHPTYPLYGEDELEEKKLDGSEIHDNVYTANVTLEPRVSRFEIYGFQYTQEGDVPKYTSVKLQKIALNNYYTQSDFVSKLPVEDTKVFETIDHTEVWGWIEDRSAPWADELNLELAVGGKKFVDGTDITDPAEDGEDAAGIITYGLAHVTDAAKNPELLLALRGVNSNSEVPLYLRGQFTNASAFTSGKIYRVLYSFTDGDFDEPERCVELNVDVADWTVVPVSPEF